MESIHKLLDVVKDLDKVPAVLPPRVLRRGELVYEETRVDDDALALEVSPV